MEDFKGTQGEWRLEKNQYGYEVFMDKTPICFTAMVESEQIREANGKLISRAPELLQMLRVIVLYSQGMVREDLIKDAEELINEITS